MTTEYGTDTSCGPDGYQPGRVVTAGALVAESIFRRITTAAGTVVDAEDHIYFDVGRHLASGATDSDLRKIDSEVRAVIASDDRIAGFSLDVARNAAGDEVVIKIKGKLSDGDAFALTFDVDEASVALTEGT